MPAVFLSWGIWEAQSSQQHCHSLNRALRGLWASRQTPYQVILATMKNKRKQNDLLGFRGEKKSDGSVT